MRPESIAVIRKKNPRTRPGISVVRNFDIHQARMTPPFRFLSRARKPTGPDRRQAEAAPPAMELRR
jgi:hypothetical protein